MRDRVPGCMLARENPAGSPSTTSFGLRRVGHDHDAMEGALMLVLLLSFATLVAAGGFSFPYCLRKRGEDRRTQLSSLHPS